MPTSYQRIMSNSAKRAHDVINRDISVVKKGMQHAAELRYTAFYS